MAITARESPPVLLVEDDPDDVELTRRAFEKNRLANALEVVTDGQAALDYLFCVGPYANRTMPQLVLLDIRLPKIDGLEVLRRMRDDERTKVLPVVVLTSSTEESDIARSYRLGANSYIRKPVDFNQFIEAVRELGLYWLVLNRPPPPAS
jgi:two-component system, response regulator